MEKRDARLFQANLTDLDDLHSTIHNWNILELESRRHLRNRVQEVIQLVDYSTLTTSEIRQHLLQGMATFGKPFAMQLVRSLNCDDHQERQAIVWLLTVLDDADTLPPLTHMTHQKNLPRAIRLSAALALAGMGATRETQQTTQNHRRVLLYAIS